MARALAWEGLFAVIVKEKRDVREFFCFGGSKLGEPLVAEVLPGDVGHFRRLGEGDLQRAGLFS